MKQRLSNRKFEGLTARLGNCISSWGWNSARSFESHGDKNVFLLRAKRNFSKLRGTLQNRAVEWVSWQDETRRRVLKLSGLKISLRNFPLK